MYSMTESLTLARAEHLPAPQRPTCPVGSGAGEADRMSEGDDGWVFSFSAQGVIPSKMQWLGQDDSATTRQQKIDDVLGTAWTTEALKIQMDPTPGQSSQGVNPAMKKSTTALYLSLAAMSQTALGCTAPGELSLPSATVLHRYDKDLGVFFMAFDKSVERIPVPHQSAVVQSLTWILDNIAALNVPDIHGLVIDELQDADEHNAPIIVGLRDDIEIRGLPLFVVQEMPAKLLRISDLNDLIVKDSRLSFVVSGLMSGGKERTAGPSRKKSTAARAA